ncbi:MAG: tetratricopeptide repeat protein [Blastochloris sp.]|nr:tetratricopeptide repeat protein [Blastochloris sp.]
MAVTLLNQHLLPRIHQVPLLPDSALGREATLARALRVYVEAGDFSGQRSVYEELVRSASDPTGQDFARLRLAKLLATQGERRQAKEVLDAISEQSQLAEKKTALLRAWKEEAQKQARKTKNTS